MLYGFCEFEHVSGFLVRETVYSKSCGGIVKLRESLLLGTDSCTRSKTSAGNVSHGGGSSFTTVRVIDQSARTRCSQLQLVATRCGEILPTLEFQPHEIIETPLLGNPSASDSFNGECIGHSVQAEPHCKDVDPFFYE